MPKYSCGQGGFKESGDDQTRSDQSGFRTIGTC
jgi:hypothetical protein